MCFYSSSPCHSSRYLGALQHLSNIPELSQTLGFGPTTRYQDRDSAPPWQSSASAGARPDFGAILMDNNEFPHFSSRNCCAAAIPDSISPKRVPSPSLTPQHRAEPSPVHPKSSTEVPHWPQGDGSHQLLSWAWGRTWKLKDIHGIMEWFGREPESSFP